VATFSHQFGVNTKVDEPQKSGPPPTAHWAGFGGEPDFQAEDFGLMAKLKRVPLLKNIIAWFRRTSAQKSPYQRMQPQTEVMKATNLFFMRFVSSELRSIEFSESDVAAGSDEILQPLATENFSRIRNRIRVISNLDPVLNVQADGGTVKLSTRMSDGQWKEFTMRAFFSAGGERIRIEKQ
jgi:hypothetical protein